MIVIVKLKNLNRKEFNISVDGIFNDPAYLSIAEGDYCAQFEYSNIAKVSFYLISAQEREEIKGVIDTLNRNKIITHCSDNVEQKQKLDNLDMRNYVRNKEDV